MSVTATGFEAAFVVKWEGWEDLGDMNFYFGDVTPNMSFWGPWPQVQEWCDTEHEIDVIVALDTMTVRIEAFNTESESVGIIEVPIVISRASMVAQLIECESMLSDVSNALPSGLESCGEFPEEQIEGAK